MQALSPIKTSNFLHASKRLHELTRIRSTAITLLKYKKDRLKLEKKYEDTKNKFATKQKILDKERRQETKKIRPKKSKLLKKSEKVASSGIIDLLITFAKIKALMWIGDPENLAKVQAIVKGLTGVFKFIDWFATGSVTNLLDGLHSLLFGGSILERIFGLFSAIVGFFGIRYLLNPFKLIKDLKFVIKNGDKIGQIFSAFKESGIKKGAADLAQKLTKTADIFKRGLSRGLGRAILKVFGKTGFKFLAKAVAPAVGGLTKLVGGPLKAIAKKTIGGIPVVGPLLNLGINLLLGDPLDKALFKTVGSTLGMGLGALVGSVFPGPGTIVGGALGGILGDWASSTLYDWMKGAISKKEEPALAVGGIVTKPTRALIGEAGPEAVIPLPKIYDGTILNAPMGIVASSMIGGIDAVISSLGPIGLTIRPYASSLLAPYRREFGASNYVFTSDIGKTSTDVTAKATTQTNDQEEVAKILGLNKTVNLIKKKEASEEAKKSRYNSGNSIREILGDILNNIINLDFTSRTKRDGGGDSGGDSGDDGGGGGGGMLPGNAPPEVKAMLEAIAGGEGSWDSVNPSTNVPGLSNMTIADARIKALQVAREKGGSGAMGKWQQMPQFILGRARDAGLDPNKDKFNQENQTKIARMLMASVYPGGEAQLVKDAQEDPLKAAARLRGTWPSLPGGSQENVHSKGFVSRYNKNVEKYAKMQQGGLVSRGDITSKFGNKESFRKNAHEGIDIAFPSGTPLSFSLGGKFIKIARTSSTEKEANGGYGQYMDVKLTDGKIARLAHLSSIPNWVKQGSEFAPNAVIALSGGIPKAPGSGRSGGAHLHLEQHTTQKDLAETLNGKVDPLSQGLFGLLRKGGAPGSATNSPAQPSQAPATSPDTVPESEETDSGSAFNPELIAKNLGELFQMLTGTSKTNGAQLQKDSMDYLQAFKDFKPNPDTYIMAGGTNIFSSTTMLTPISQPDYSVGSFSSIDSATAFNLKTRL